MRWSNLLLIIATLFAYCAPNIAPSTSRYFIFIGMAFPFLFLFHLFFISYWAIKRKRFFIYSLLCLLIGWSHVKGVLGLHLGSSDDPKSLKIMTFNSGGIVLNSSNPKKDQSIPFAAFLEKYNPDILCVQEFFSEANQTFILQHFPYQEIAPLTHYKYITIYSKYPFEYGQDLKYYNESNGCILADVNVNGKKVRIYVAHLLSNHVTGMAEKVTSKLENGQINKKESKEDLIYVVRNISKSAKIREKQSAEIALHAQKSPYPTIICGDFNDPPLSYAYQTLAEGRQDAFKEAGFGFSSTYLGGIPFLCIDHILVSEVFEVLDCVVPNVEFSDHYPVMATLRWK
ncbi:MAG: hypothetical protein RLZZ292_60 [Bacteroidota bacterium]